MVFRYYIPFRELLLILRNNFCHLLKTITQKTTTAAALLLLVSHFTIGGILDVSILLYKVAVSAHNDLKYSVRILKEKGRDLTQPHDKSPYTNRNVKRAR